MIQQLILERRKIFLVRIIIPNYYLGSTSVITNESGGVVEETFYDPYGGILEGGSSSRHQYEGKEFSSATGDYDFHFRKYNPEIGIFTQPEQLFPNVYDPQQLNRYRFERNNPYKYVDPTGKVFQIPIIMAIGIAIGTSMLVNYGLEIYHGIREDATFEEDYEAGALRSGQDVGGALTLTNPEKTTELGLDIVAKRASSALTILQIIEEISSGRKSSYLRKSGYQWQQFVSTNPFSNQFSNVRGAESAYSQISYSLVTSPGTYYINNVKYQASQDRSGNYYCGIPNKQTSGVSGGGNTGSGSSGGQTPQKNSDFGKQKNIRCGWGMSCA